MLYEQFRNITSIKRSKSSQLLLSTILSSSSNITQCLYKIIDNSRGKRINTPSDMASGDIESQIGETNNNYKNNRRPRKKKGLIRHFVEPYTRQFV